MTKLEYQERTPTHRGLIVPAFGAVILSLLLTYILSPLIRWSPAPAFSDFSSVEQLSPVAKPVPRLLGFIARLECHDQGSGEAAMGRDNLGSRIVVARHFKPAAAPDFRGTMLRPAQRDLVSSDSSLRPVQFCPTSLHVLLCLWRT